MASNWRRGTELVRLFVATGAVADVRPASLLLVGQPGLGKTELLERFRTNKCLSYHSDLTVKPLVKLLRLMQHGKANHASPVSHLCFTEFQKLFQRKDSVWQNCLGTLAQAMEEGVAEYSVGREHVVLRNVRVGVLAGMTVRSLGRFGEPLDEMGILSRASVIPWSVDDDEVKRILTNIARGDATDLNPVVLQLPERPVRVTCSERTARPLQDYVFAHHRAVALRLFQRLRVLAMARAVLCKRDRVTRDDVDYVLGFRGDAWDHSIDTAPDVADLVEIEEARAETVQAKRA